MELANQEARSFGQGTTGSVKQTTPAGGCCIHNASTVPWTSVGQFGRPRGVRGRSWYDL